MKVNSLKGYTLPRTPKGSSSLAPAPPWHYVGNCLAVEYEADPVLVRAFLPDGLEWHSPQCAAYFMEWQFATDAGDEYLDPQVLAGYRFSFAFTVDDLQVLRKLPSTG